MKVDFYFDAAPFLTITFQHFICSSFRMRRISSNVVMRVGTNGRRKRFLIIPIILSIAFTPAGLPSTKSNLKSSVN
jgi:hypothetical protein